MGLNHLLDQAKLSVEIVSPYWALTSTDQGSRLYSTYQGQFLFQRLLSLKSRGVKLKIASDQPNSAELKGMSDRYAEVRYVNMTALTKGRLLSSFWVVDRKHIYIGSAGMNWKALSKLKELGLVVYDCSCLALDLHRIFSLYWQLQYRDYIPSIWSKRVTAVFSKDEPLKLRLNNTDASAYVSTSPKLFCPKGRSRDIDAMRQVIQTARRFIYISVTDYLPLLNRSLKGLATSYWSPVDEMLREAAVLREVKVRLLINMWTRTHPLTFNFMTSMQALCTGLPGCSVEVRFYKGKEQTGGFQQRVNENKFMVTDNAVYIGNLDWVGSDFAFNAGVGLVIEESQNQTEYRQNSIVEQMTAVFERDWFSPYTISLQAGRNILQESPNTWQKLQAVKIKPQSTERK